MIHAFHPEAASEYAEHVAFYKSLSAELEPVQYLLQAFKIAG